VPQKYYLPETIVFPDFWVSKG